MEAAAATLGFTTGGDARVHFFLWREHWRSIEDEDEGRENLELKEIRKGERALKLEAREKGGTGPRRPRR
jgi:hypothetical protein